MNLYHVLRLFFLAIGIGCLIASFTFNMGDTEALWHLGTAVSLCLCATFGALSDQKLRRVTFFLPAAGLLLIAVPFTASAFTYSVDAGEAVVLRDGHDTVKIDREPGRYFKPVWYEAKSFPTRWEWQSRGGLRIEHSSDMEIAIQVYASVEVLEEQIEAAMKFGESNDFNEVLKGAFRRKLLFMEREQVLNLWGSGSRELLDALNAELAEAHIKLTRLKITGSATERHLIDLQQLDR